MDVIGTKDLKETDNEESEEVKSSVTTQVAAVIPQTATEEASAEQSNSDVESSVDSEIDENVIKEAEDIVQDLETEIPEHLREIVIAHTTNALEAAGKGKSPEKFLVAAQKAINSMKKTNSISRKLELLSNALFKIHGASDATRFLHAGRDDGRDHGRDPGRDHGRERGSGCCKRMKNCHGPECKLKKIKHRKGKL